MLKPRRLEDREDSLNAEIAGIPGATAIQANTKDSCVARLRDWVFSCSS
jgi:hypothetical protein